MHDDLQNANPATEGTNICLRSSGDDAIAEPRIAFRISIGAGAILMLIAAALLLASALSKAVAMP
jgi:hypothetical protein